MRRGRLGITLRNGRAAAKEREIDACKIERRDVADGQFSLVVLDRPAQFPRIVERVQFGGPELARPQLLEQRLADQARGADDGDAGRRSAVDHGAPAGMIGVLTSTSAHWPRCPWAWR